MKTCYAYHPETLEYLGETSAPASPLEPGKYLIPAFAVQNSPEAAGVLGDNQVYCWEDWRWVIRPDHRGQTWWNLLRESVTITAIGQTPLDNWTSDPPPDEHHQLDLETLQWYIPLETLRTLKRREIRDEADRRLELAAPRSQVELATWERQERAALKYLSDPSGVDPDIDYLKTLADALIASPDDDGSHYRDYAQGILSEIRQYRAHRDAIYIIQKQLEQALESAANAAGIQIINWPQ